MTIERSLEWWQRYGQHVLMASPYKDHVIVRASGCTITDADGNEYLDMISGQICALTGHGHPALVERVTRQIAQVAHTGSIFLSPVVFEAAAALARIAPGALTECLFLSTGAEANEYALRLAKVYTRKTGVLALTKGYAGLTLQTSSLSNYGKGAHPVVPGTGYLLVPDPTERPADRDPLEWSRDLLAQSLELNRGLLDNVAAIIVEPILSAGGLIVLPDGYLRALQQLAHELGALLIADEAQTGMGRTGRWFGVEHDDVVPDILVVAKGAGGGFPSSAVLTSAAIGGAVMTRTNQFSSHQNDPLGAAATLAVIETIERDGLIDRAARMGGYLRERLNGLANRWPHLRNVRGRGLMVGVDIVRDPGNPQPEAAVGRLIEDFLWQHGIHIEAIQRNRFRVLPPLTISQQEIDRFVAVLEEAVAALAHGDLVPQPFRNPRTAAYEARAKRRHGVSAAAQWVLTHSPKEWFIRARPKRR